MSLCLVDIHGEIEGDYDIIHIFPRNATNGDMIKAMFPNAWKSDFIDIANHSTLYVDDKHELEVDIDWWNAPYKGGKEE